jgi:hypothetical protein
MILVDKKHDAELIALSAHKVQEYIGQCITIR